MTEIEDSRAGHAFVTCEAIQKEGGRQYFVGPDISQVQLTMILIITFLLLCLQRVHMKCCLSGTPAAEDSLPTDPPPSRQEKDCDTTELDCHDKLHNRGISPTRATGSDLGQIEGGLR